MKDYYSAPNAHSHTNRFEDKLGSVVGTILFLAFIGLAIWAMLNI